MQATVKRFLELDISRYPNHQPHSSTVNPIFSHLISPLFHSRLGLDIRYQPFDTTWTNAAAGTSTSTSTSTATTKPEASNNKDKKRECSGQQLTISMLHPAQPNGSMLSGTRRMETSPREVGKRVCNRREGRVRYTICKETASRQSGHYTRASTIVSLERQAKQVASKLRQNIQVRCDECHRYNVVFLFLFFL